MLGLPDWPFITKGEAERLWGWRPGFGWWKEAVVETALGQGRRVIWIDDQLTEESPLVTLVHPQRELRVCCPESEVGLRLEDLQDL